MIEPRDIVRNLDPYTPPIEGRGDMVRLDFNEFPYPLPPTVVEEFRKMPEWVIRSYPEYSKVNRALSGFFGSDQFILVNGLDDGIMLLTRTFLDRGDTVLVPVPTFPMYSFYARQMGAVVEEIEYGQDLSFPYGALTAALSEGANMVFICSPNNPTGTEVSMNYIRETADRFPRTVFVIDQAYISSRELPFVGDNVVILRTFSKVFGLAGLRVGCVFGSTDVIASLRRMASPYAVNSIAAWMVEKVIEHAAEFEKAWARTESIRQYLSSEIQARGFTTIPSSSNFILVNFGAVNNYISRYLRSEGILIRDQSSKPLLKGYSRISVGTRSQVDDLLSVIDEALIQPTFLFDMDGVLVDVSNSYCKAIISTVKRFSGVEVSSSNIERVRAKGGFNNDWDLTEELLRELGYTIEKSEIISVFQEYYLGDFDGLILRETLLPTREKLSEFRRFRTGIVTGRPRAEAEFTLKRFGIKDLFDVVVCMEDVERGKPSPDGVLKAIAELRASETTTYYGDTIDDIEAAQAAGVEPVIITKNPSRFSGIRSVRSVNEVRL